MLGWVDDVTGAKERERGEESVTDTSYLYVWVLCMVTSGDNPLYGEQKVQLVVLGKSGMMRSSVALAVEGRI